MSFFRLALFLIGITYGGITVLCSSIQLKQRKINLWASLAMIVGGALIIMLIAISSIFISIKNYILIGALTLIHVAAVNNGLKMHGKINPKHHVIRLGISLLIVVLFLLK